MSALTLGKIRVTGLNELRDKLRSLPPKVARSVLRPALERAANTVAAVAENEAPVRTGRLRQSIRVVNGRGAKIRSFVIVGAGFFKGETFYGGFVHFGHGIGKRTSAVRSLQRLGNARRRSALLSAVDTRRKVPPNPFLRRAFQKSEGFVTATMLTDISNGIERVAAGRSA